MHSLLAPWAGAPPLKPRVAPGSALVGTQGPKWAHKAPGGAHKGPRGAHKGLRGAHQGPRAPIRAQGGATMAQGCPHGPKGRPAGLKGGPWRGPGDPQGGSFVFCRDFVSSLKMFQNDNNQKIERPEPGNNGKLDYYAENHKYNQNINQRNIPCTKNRNKNQIIKPIFNIGLAAGRRPAANPILSICLIIWFYV